MVTMDELEKIRKRKMKELVDRFKIVNAEIEVNDNNFDKEVIEKSRQTPVVVDFWATWCTPCLILAPILEKVVKEYRGKLILAKLNIDENPLISHKYGITTIPTVKLFKDGNFVDEFIGALPEQEVRKWLNKNLT